MKAGLWGLFPAANWMPLDFAQGESDEKDVVLMYVPYKPAVSATCESGMGLPNIVGRGLGGGGDAHQEPDVRVCDWVGGGTPPGGGPGGGGTGGQYCAVLLMSKPAGCTSEIPVRGADYAAHKFMVGSGLATALSNLSNSNISSQARQQMLAALNKHTDDYSDIRKSVNDNNIALVDGMALACDYQRQYDLSNPPLSPYVGGVSPGLKACLGTVGRLNGEANLSFTSFFQSWLNRTGIDLSDLGIPQTIINWFAPENSLSTKIEAANEQNACNLWFGEVRRNGC